MQSRRDYGFTLIELLVVIAIIAILAAILFPVFAAARERARQTACLSHIKQVGTAVLMYENDYEGYFPPCGWEWGTDSWWMSQWPSTHYIRFWLNPYVKNENIWRCPSDRFAPETTFGGLNGKATPGMYEQTGTSFQWVRCGYHYPDEGYPLVWQGPVCDPNATGGQWRGHNAYAAKRIAEMPILADTLQWHFRVGADPSSTQPTWKRYRRNVCFADGHAEAMIEDQFNLVRDTIKQY